MRSKYLGIVFLLLACGPVHAANVLYFADSFSGTNYVLPALTAGSHTVTTASSWSDFNTRLAGGGFDLAIAICQANAHSLDVTTMSNYLNAGGNAILADWTQDGTFGALFGATYAGVTNQTPATLTAATLYAGITNPVALLNPGWGVWSMGLTPTGTGTSLGTFPNGNACIVSSFGGRAILLGFLADTLPSADGQRFFENLIGTALTGTTNIPTLTEWGMIIFFVLITGVALVNLKKRRNVAAC